MNLNFFFAFTFFAQMMFAQSRQNLEYYWSASNLNFDHVAIYFNNTKCFEFSPSFTIACIKGYNKVGLLANPRRMLIPADMAGKIAFDDLRLIQRYGPLIHIEFKKIKGFSTYSKYLKFRNEVSIALAAYADFFHKQKDKKIEFNFADLIKELRKVVSPTIPDSMIVGLAISEQLSFSDAHSRLIPGTSIADRSSSNHDTVYDIGAVFFPAERGYSVYEVADGSPAANAGLRLKDVILQVDKNEIDFNLSTEDVRRMISGPIHTPVKLTIARGDKRINFTIQRETYVQQEVSTKIFKTVNGSVLYIKITSLLAPNTCENVASLIEQAKKTSGIIIDLRNNLGGLLAQTKCLAGLFLPKGTAVYSTKPISLLDSAPTENVLTESEPVSADPIVVIANEITASAAEILVGSLQFHNRVMVVGEKTSGKSSSQAQDPFEYDPMSTTLIHTTDIVFLPNGLTSQAVGISPDVRVVIGENTNEFTFREVDIFPNTIIVPDKIANSPLNSGTNLLAHCTSDFDKNNFSLHDHQLAQALNVFNCLSS